MKHKRGWNRLTTTHQICNDVPYLVSAITWFHTTWHQRSTNVQLLITIYVSSIILNNFQALYMKKESYIF